MKCTECLRRMTQCKEEFLMVSVHSTAGEAEPIASLGADGRGLLNFVLNAIVQVIIVPEIL